MELQCEQCAFYEWDEEFELYSCLMAMDEDEVQQISYRQKSCPYFRFGDTRL